jgi:hypothetical protein
MNGSSATTHMNNTSASSSTSSTSIPATMPTNKQTSDQVTYRDLVIFEERLRGNMIRLRRRKKKFEGK